MPKRMIIVITGIDGSGKTTIARHLLNLLLHRGYKARIVWVKSLHTLAYLIYKFFQKTWGTEYIINPNNIIVEHYTTPWMQKMGKLGH